MKKILLALSTALFALIFVFSLSVNTASAAFPGIDKAIQLLIDAGLIKTEQTVDVKAILDGSTIAKVNAVCGIAAKKYTALETIFASSTTATSSAVFCAKGTVKGDVNPTFPGVGQKISWTCIGKNKGAEKTCSAERALGKTEKIKGACGESAKTYTVTDTAFATTSAFGFCKTGTPSVTPTFPGLGASQNWTCLGANGGGNSTCTLKRLSSAQKVNAVCGVAKKAYKAADTAFATSTTAASSSVFCAKGTVKGGVDPVFPGVGQKISWTCIGENEGKETSCSITRAAGTVAKVNGACGTASKTYTKGETSFGDLTLCKAGNPSLNPVPFPGLGSTQSWTCLGDNGGADSKNVCKAVNKSKAGTTATTTASLDENLKSGDQGIKVSLLQQVLKQVGLYNGPVNGSFGDLTKKSVMSFQKANAIDAVGEVGPKTRELLNFILGR